MWSSLIIPVRPVVCDDFVKCRTCWLHQLPEARESNPTESDLFLLFLFPLPGSHFSISSKSPLVRGGLVTFPMFPTVQTSSNHCWNFWRPSSRQDGAQELTDAQRGQRRLRCRFQDHLDDAQIKAMKPWKPWKMDGELCLDSIFRKKNVELTHWTMKHIGKFTLNKTRNWLRTGGLSNQPIYWGVVGCFMGYINTMKWGSPRKNWGSTSTSHQKLVTPIQHKCVSHPWFFLSGTLGSPTVFPHARAVAVGFQPKTMGAFQGLTGRFLPWDKCVCIYIYTHLCVCLFIYLCIDILLYIDVYYLYVYIFHRIHGEIQDFVHHSWNHSWSWELEHFQIQAAQSLQLHPGASGEPPPARDGGQFSAGRDGEKMWKDQKIQKYEITKSPNYWRYHLAQSFNGDFWNHHDRTLRQLVTSGISISSWGYHQQTMRYNQHGTTDYCGHNLKNQNGLSYSTDSQLASAVLLCLLLLILGDHTFLWGKSGGKWCK